jgi:hypothetical protein
MKPGLKYLLIIISASVAGLGLLFFLGNSQPNIEVIVFNQSDQPIESIQLRTEKSGKNIVLRGIVVGTRVAVKFHNDGADTFSIHIRFADGKELKGENIFFEPGHRVLETVTEKEILTKHENLMSPAK